MYLFNSSTIITLEKFICFRQYKPEFHNMQSAYHTQCNNYVIDEYIFTAKKALLFFKVSVWTIIDSQTLTKTVLLQRERKMGGKRVEERGAEGCREKFYDVQPLESISYDNLPSVSRLQIDNFQLSYNAFVCFWGLSEHKRYCVKNICVNILTEVNRTL